MAERAYATLVLLRHGESEWNNAEKNLFCGWVDVELSQRGLVEAHDAGRSLRDHKVEFDAGFTSYLKRYSFTSYRSEAERFRPESFMNHIHTSPIPRPPPFSKPFSRDLANVTLEIVLEEIGHKTLHIEKSWRLNERHYGGLTGFNKHDSVEKFGLRQVEIWRRSFEVPPPPLPETSPYHPRHDKLYEGVDPALLPSTESLKDVIARLMPYYDAEIKPLLLQGKNVLVVSHGSVVRCISKILLGISDTDIEKFDVPTAIPYVFEFDKDLKVTKNYFLADDDKVKAEQEKIRNQIHANPKA